MARRTQVLADALTLGLMCYASILEPDDADDEDRLELIYASALMVQVRRLVPVFDAVFFCCG